MTVVDGLLYGADEKIAAWVERRIPQQLEPFREPVAIGVLAAGQVVAGVVFHDYHGRDIQFSVAADSPRWCRKAILRRLFAYPFLQLGCHRITATTSSANARAQRALEGMGLTLEGALREALPDGSDLLLYGLLRRDCRWIPNGLTV